MLRQVAPMDLNIPDNWVNTVLAGLGGMLLPLTLALINRGPALQKMVHEELKTVMAQKDSLIADLQEENDGLRSQVRALRNEYDKLRTDMRAHEEATAKELTQYKMEMESLKKELMNRPPYSVIQQNNRRQKISNVDRTKDNDKTFSED
jgi:peptidoglycan hydrolase CwlO-like protein